MKKKILYLLGVALLGLSSCTPIDNWDEPDCTFYGTVIDSYTGEPLLASQNDWQIRIWERSFTGQKGGATTQQDLRIKQDGTYQNTKLFAGTYDMLPYDGPFFPVDTVKSVKLSGSTKQDFTVTPYFQVLDFDVEVTTHNFATAENPDIRPALILSCRIKAPRMEGLPNMYDIQGFISTSIWCGNGNDSKIDIPQYTSFVNGDDDPATPYDERGGQGRIEVRRNWVDGCKFLNPTWVESDTSPVTTVGPLPVKSGYTYHVRMGVSSDTGNRRFNYSPIQEITIP